MNKIKNIIYTLLLISIMTITINVLAQPESTTSDFSLENVTGTTDPESYRVKNTASLTINNVSSSDTFYAYKIIDVFYNTSTNVVTYEFTLDFKTFLAQSDIYKSLTISDYYNLTSGDIMSGSTQTSSTLDKLVSKYSLYKMHHGIDTNYMTTSGTTASASLNSGVYLVLPNSTQRIYAVMVGNLTPTASNGSWVINDFTINAKVSDASAVKYIGKEGQTVGSYSYGDEVPSILVATLPQFPTNANGVVVLLGDVVDPIFDLPTYNKFTVKDGNTTLTTKSDGTVVDSSGNVVATITIPNEYWSEQLGGRVVTITVNHKYLKSTKVTVTYNLTLNSSATVSTSGNQNAAGLVINSDVYNESANATGKGSYIPYYTYTTIYTYGIDLLAYKKNDKSTTLSDMTFDVYKDSSLTQKLGTITTDSSGKGTLAGVGEGTYYIKNTKAKSGYGLATTTSMKVKISGSVASTTDGYYKVEIEVPEAGSLPLTGGSGIVTYIIIGLLIILVAIIGFVLYSKNKDK